jgi:hypothetical protein
MSLDEGRLGANEAKAADDGTEFEYLLHRTDAPYTPTNFELLGMVLKAPDEQPFSAVYQGASPDFAHILFLDGNRALLPAAINTNADLYDLVTQALGNEVSLRLVGLNNKGKAITPICLNELGASRGPAGALTNAVAMDGREVFFTLRLEAGLVGECPKQLFVRLNGSKTIEVSRPLLPVCHEVPCAGAFERKPVEYQGASEDGSNVFFQTEQSLVNEDTDTTDDLYMADIGCPVGEEGCEVANREVVSMAQVSHGDEPAEVQGVVATANDGSRVFFVARGVLSQGGNGNGAMPVKGADNLYMYDSATKALVFVAELCSGPGISGPKDDNPVEDVACPAGLANSENDVALWTTNSPEAQFSGDERFLVFSSYGQLVGNDTDGTRDVYRYDAETGGLERVSVGEGGYDANGNGAFDASIGTSHSFRLLLEQRHMNSRAVSADGTGIIFRTNEPLSSAAVNGQGNVYEWHAGAGEFQDNVSLVSTGSADAGVEGAVMSSSGSDIFFATTQGLVSQDGDGQLDLYDARVGGGFSERPALREPCSGDACQGPLIDPTPLLVPGSAVQAPGGNLARPVNRLAPSKKKARKAHRSHGRRRSGHAGRVKRASGGRGRR